MELANLYVTDRYGTEGKRAEDKCAGEERSTQIPPPGRYQVSHGLLLSPPFLCCLKKMHSYNQGNFKGIVSPD